MHACGPASFSFLRSSSGSTAEPRFLTVTTPTPNHNLFAKSVAMHPYFAANLQTNGVRLKDHVTGTDPQTGRPLYIFAYDCLYPVMTRQ